MPNIGPLEIIVILLLALVFFGARRLPELGKGLGQGIREFKKAGRDIRSDLEDSFKDEPVKQPVAASNAPASSEPKA
ncbi:MAG: twin-arginine translocase TatA/TatE family subunit [Pleurocapsa sp. SU_196_0]|jgi:sec-independent protein translocase protein TatA|nr:twin-arginine translocase TatA/TatE family subunit [Pleurocapsa sp. SU_196_0]